MTTDLRDPALLYTLFDADPAPIVEFLAWLAVRHGLPSRPAMLDVGCGPGRLLPPLAARGWQVVGLEPAVLRCARHGGGQACRREREGGRVQRYRRSPRVRPRGRNQRLFLARAHGDRKSRSACTLCPALRPGGLLVLDLPNALRILLEYRQAEPREATVDGRVVHYERQHTVEYHTATFTTRETYTVIERDGERWTFDKDHVYAITAWPDLEYLLGQAGFTAIELFPSVTAREPAPLTGPRLIVVQKIT